MRFHGADLQTTLLRKSTQFNKIFITMFLIYCTVPYLFHYGLLHDAHAIQCRMVRSVNNEVE
jgi:hypothetical protein